MEMKAGLSLSPHHPEAHEAVPEIRLEIPAVGRAAAIGVEIPTPAPFHPERPRIPVGVRRTDVAGVIPIPVVTPLPHVAVHVIKPPGIRGFLSDRMGFTVAVAFIPSGQGEIALTVAGIISRRGARTAGVLPFRFGRKPEPVF